MQRKAVKAGDGASTSTLSLAASRPASFPAALRDRGGASGSRHMIFSENRCTGCHDMSKGFAPPPKNAELCDQCHGERRRKENWNHGPINLNSCDPCHHVHESPYPRLLKMPVPELCLNCHEPLRAGPDGYHPRGAIRAEVPLRDCLACHNGHRV